MNVFGRSDPPTMPTRELRRLGHSTAVPTTYVSRDIEVESMEAHRATAVRQGYEEGYAEGLAKALADAERSRGEESHRVEGALSALARAVTAVQEAGVRQRTEIQSTAPKLAFALLEELLTRELELADNPGRDAIIRVLALDEGAQPAMIRMNPKDIEQLGEIADLDLGREVIVIPDPAVEMGGALVEIGHAILDGQLGTALERVRRILLGPAELEVGDDRAA